MRFEAESSHRMAAGETLLHKACQSDHAAAAALIALGPHTGPRQLIRDETGLLLVDHAILNGNRSTAAAALRGVPLEELNTLSLLLLPLLLQTGNLEPPDQASLNAGLRAAAASGRDAAVDLLLKNKAEVNSEQEDGATALVLASRPGHVNVARRLLGAGAHPDPNRSPLRMAAKSGRLELVKLLLQYRADVEASNVKKGGTPLFLASKGGHLDCMEELMKARAMLTGKDWSPLHAAVQSGKEAVHLLLTARASPSVPAQTWAPLHEAARRRSASITELLLNHGSAVDATTADGATALHVAVQQGHEETAQVLLSRGASAGCIASSGATPLHYAVQLGHLHLTQLLLVGKNADPDQSMVDTSGTESGCRPLHFAAQLGFQEILRALLAARASTDTEMRGGFTPLALAARAGHMTCCNLLLESSESRLGGKRAIDAITAMGWTPLHLACKAGQPAVARALIELGASVNILSKRGRTPLMVAVEAGHFDIVKLLVRFGADLDATMPGNWTALHLACMVPRNGQMVRFLLQHTQLRSTDEGWMPLHSAVHSGDESNVKAVLEVQPMTEAPGQVPPLHLAAEAGHASLVRLLLERGASVDAPASHDITALHLAAGAGGSPQPATAAEVAEVLLAHGAAVDLVMEGGATPLMVAARLGRSSVVKVLLQYGADVFSKLPSGWCSFLLAVRNGHAEVVRMLVRPEHQQVKTPAGRTPIQCAKKYGHSEAEQVLRELLGES
ncbi:unnamed protein product [Cladocopium goreaui]|uniref:Succinate dehydrogenase [ubiquinone] iron-sulfur subunit, mitochondrial n=1 Tax=Cladocopium goreaui TaxID=2562237 RepID=A0A9P1C3P8_9DINO|nr:unnamed protein product [Cladocopium goreaui]